MWAFGLLVHQINSLYVVLKLKQNFQKNKAATDKTWNRTIAPRDNCPPNIATLEIVTQIISPWTISAQTMQNNMYPRIIATRIMDLTRIMFIAT